MPICIPHGHRPQCGEGRGRGWVDKEGKIGDIYNSVNNFKKREEFTLEIKF